MPTGFYDRTKSQPRPKCSEETKRKISEANKGKKASSETIEKLRQSHLGQKAWNKGLKYKNPKLSQLQKGRKLSEDWRKSMSEAQKRAGNKPPNHKGKTYKQIYGERYEEEIEKRRNTHILAWDKKGRTTDFQRPKHHSWIYRNWAKKVMLRDNYTCQHCGQRGGKLQADHIKPFALIVRENNIKTMKEAMNCKELWDIINGRTLCIDCHKKTDTFSYKTRLLLKRLENKK